MVNSRKQKPGINAQVASKGLAMEMEDDGNSTARKAGKFKSKSGERPATDGQHQEPPYKKSKPQATKKDKAKVDAGKPKADTIKGDSSKRAKLKNRKTMDKDPFQRVPNELIHLIFGLLSSIDLVRCERVNVRWMNAVRGWIDLAGIRTHFKDAWNTQSWDRTGSSEAQFKRLAHLHSSSCQGKLTSVRQITPLHEIVVKGGFVVWMSDRSCQHIYWQILPHGSNTAAASKVKKVSLDALLSYDKRINIQQGRLHTFAVNSDGVLVAHLRAPSLPTGGLLMKVDVVYSLVNEKVIRSDFGAVSGGRQMIGKKQIYHTIYHTDSLVATDLYTGTSAYEVFTNPDIKVDTQEQICEFVLVELMDTELIVQYPRGYYYDPEIRAILFRDAVTGTVIRRTNYEEARSRPEIVASGNIITLIQSLDLPHSTDKTIVMDTYYWNPKETLSLLSSRWLQIPMIYNNHPIVNPLSSQVFWVVSSSTIEMKLMREVETPKEEVINGVVIKHMQLQDTSIPLTLPPLGWDFGKPRRKFGSVVKCRSLYGLKVLDERRLLLRSFKSHENGVYLCDFGPKW